MARQHWPNSQSHGELSFSWCVPHMPSLFASVLAAPCAAKQTASSTKQKVRKPQVNQPKATQKQGPVKPQRSGMAPSARPLTKSKAPASRSRHREKLSPLSLWHSFGKRWQAGPGSHVLPSHVSGASRKHVWLEWRSTGMGCTLCPCDLQGLQGGQILQCHACYPPSGEVVRFYVSLISSSTSLRTSYPPGN